MLFVILVMAGFLVFSLRKKGLDSKAKHLIWISVLCLGAYLLFIAFTHSITIPQIDIIDRMLSPVYPFFVLLVIASLYFAMEAGGWQRILYYSAILAILIVLRFNFLTTLAYVNELKTFGRGYSARQYRQSGIIEQIKEIPENQRMVSNSAGFVLYYTNRFPIQVNQFANRTFGMKNGNGEKWFREKGASLILFFPEFRNYYGDTADELLSTITNGLDVYYLDDVSGIYYYPKTPATQP